MNLLIKKIGVLFFLFSAGVSIATAENSSLDEITQEIICATTINSLPAMAVCVNEKVDPERLAVCAQYTASPLSEVLCLKQRELSSNTILSCFLTDTVLEEQACLLYPNSYDSFIMSLSDFEQYSIAIKAMKTEIEELLGLTVAFNMLELQFKLLEDTIIYQERSRSPQDHNIHTPDRKEGIIL